MVVPKHVLYAHRDQRTVLRKLQRGHRQDPPPRDLLWVHNRPFHSFRHQYRPPLPVLNQRHFQIMVTQITSAKMIPTGTRRVNLERRAMRLLQSQLNFVLSGSDKMVHWQKTHVYLPAIIAQALPRRMMTATMTRKTKMRRKRKRARNKNRKCIFYPSYIHI